MPYLKWKETTITNFSDKNITSLYDQGYVFTRQGKGVMNQTRSLRIDLNKFELSSENRRVLKKTEAVSLTIHELPYAAYDWTVGKLGKDFYDTKFGDKTFSANKIKELVTEPAKSNFNCLLTYTDGGAVVGYCIAFQTSDILHYCYPFYPLENGQSTISNLGLGMMVKAIVWTKEQGLPFIYLGSAQRPTDTYKLQFSGLEWWDGKKWEKDTITLKTLLLDH